MYEIENTMKYSFVVDLVDLDKVKQIPTIWKEEMLNCKEIYY